MYSDCSSKYWKQRRKPNANKIKLISILSFLTTILLLIGYQRNIQYRRFQETQRLLEEQNRIRNIRPNATDVQYQLCESNMRDRMDVECIQLCKDEIVSVPRPTMYQSCVHGCSRSYLPAARNGCQMGGVSSVETSSSSEIFDDQSSSKAMISCSRFQRVEPQPYVFSTCRKYFREGSIKGRKMGYELINGLIDAEWKRIRNEV